MRPAAAANTAASSGQTGNSPLAPPKAIGSPALGKANRGRSAGSAANEAPIARAPCPQLRPTPSAWARARQASSRGAPSARRPFASGEKETTTGLRSRAIERIAPASATVRTVSITNRSTPASARASACSRSAPGPSTPATTTGPRPRAAMASRARATAAALIEATSTSSWVASRAREAPKVLVRRSRAPAARWPRCTSRTSAGRTTDSSSRQVPGSTMGRSAVPIAASPRTGREEPSGTRSSGRRSDTGPRGYRGPNHLSAPPSPR